MKRFAGFPARMQFTPLPNLFFSSLLEQIDDITELKVTLYIFAALYRKKGHPRLVTYQELLGDTGLMQSLRCAPEPPPEALRHALAKSVERGTILHLAMERDGQPEDIYFLNNDANKEVITRVRSGELALSGLETGAGTYVDTEAPPDIFTLYEQNIGMLTPMIADQLREATKLYPEGWIRDAIREAVSHNKRRWSYISAILENWSSQGKGDGEYRRDFKQTDPDKYIKGEYGHMVRR